MNKLNFKDYFILPFHADENGSYIWDAKGNMVANGSMKINQKIVDILNDKVESTTKSPVHYYNGCIFNSNDKIILILRGWGHLTGIGGYHLNAEDAIEVINQLGKFIEEKLNHERYRD